MQLSDFYATILIGQVVAVPPLSVEELRALDRDFGELDTIAGLDLGGDNRDSRIETEDKTGVCPIEDQIAAGQEDFAGSGDGSGGFRQPVHSCKL